MVTYSMTKRLTHLSYMVIVSGEMHLYQVVVLWLKRNVLYQEVVLWPKCSVVLYQEVVCG